MNGGSARVNELRTFVTYLLFLCGEVYYLCFYSLHLRRTKKQYLMKEVIKLDTVDQYTDSSDSKHYTRW